MGNSDSKNNAQGEDLTQRQSNPQEVTLPELEEPIAPIIFVQNSENTVKLNPLDTPADTTTPNMSVNTIDIESKLKNLSLTGGKDINILLLGETGVGKSTFINAIFNYLQFKDFETAEKEDLNVLIPTKFTEYDKNDKPHYIEIGSRDDSNELRDVGTSATQKVKTYTFQINKGQTLVRLIDTPGMGDTRGIEQDNVNCENILNYISRIHQLHAICYLCRPHHSRATASFKYCVAQIMSRLEKSACKNIIFVFTHSRGNNYSPGETFELLKQLCQQISSNSANAKIPLENNRFCFDNEAFRFLAAVKNGVEFKKEIRRINIDSWNRSTEQCWKMIEYITGLRPHFVKHTSAINEARRIIYQLSQPMADIAQLINDNIYLLQRHETYLNTNRANLYELKKKLYIPIIDLEVTQLPHPVTVCTDSSCTEVYVITEGRKESHYKTRCHDPCYLTNVPKEMVGSPELINCASMGPDQVCKSCTHSYRVHMHIYYMTKKKENKIKDKNVLKNINTEEAAIETAKRTIEDIRDRKKRLETELSVIVECNAKFAYFLQKNAIAPFSDAYAGYIEHLIIKENGLGANADISKLAGLQKLLKEHNEMKRVFEQAANMQKVLGKQDEITAQSISKTLQELFQLDLNGTKIKELYESQKKSLSKEYKHTEYTHSTPFSQEESKKKKNESSASNPTTKFQHKQYRRGNQNNQSNQRGRSNVPQQGNRRNRSPPPSYDAVNQQNPVYPNAGTHPPPHAYPHPPPPLPHAYPPPHPQGYDSHPRSPYPATPDPNWPPSSASAKKPEEKPSTIQVNVTLPTAAGEAKDNTGDRPPRDHPPYPDYYRDARDPYYGPRDHPGDYPPRPDYPRDPYYPPRPGYPRDPYYPHRPDYPRDPYYPPRPDYPRDPHVPPRPDYPRDPHYPPRPDDYPRDPYYPPRPNDPRDPYYAPRRDYHPDRPEYGPRDHYRPGYEQRGPSTSNYAPNTQRPQNNNPGPGRNNNRRGDNSGNFRGRGNRGGITKTYHKKNHVNTSNDDGNDSDN